MSKSPYNKSPHKLTRHEARRAQHMFFNLNMRVRSIARRMHLAESSVHAAVHGEISAEQPRKPTMQIVAHIQAPEEVLAERDRRKELQRQSIVSALCGDPLPGYSALDQRTSSL